MLNPCFVELFCTAFCGGEEVGVCEVVVGLIV